MTNRTIYLFRGLPGSGKDTKAAEMMRESPGQYKRVNKDLLRKMLDDGIWGKRNEKYILRVRDQLTLLALREGYDVLVTDTNLHRRHHERMLALAGSLGVENLTVGVQLVDLTDVSVAECIRRDLLRPHSVGEAVIKRMWRDFLAPAPLVPVVNPDLPPALIIDLDGTLAHLNGRSPYDATGACINDPLVEAVHRVVVMEHDAGTAILITTGRDEVVRGPTEEWLTNNNVPYDDLFMRIEGDKRPDTVIKAELYHKYIEGVYTVRYVLDDRNSVVDLWRSLGLTTWQVAAGDF